MLGYLRIRAVEHEAVLGTQARQAVGQMDGDRDTSAEDGTHCIDYEGQRFLHWVCYFAT